MALRRSTAVMAALALLLITGCTGDGGVGGEVAAVAGEQESNPATPTTEVGSEEDSDGEAGGGDPEAAAADVWMVVFDSATSFDAKSPHLADAGSLRATIEAYASAGASMGGIALEPTAVSVDGDVATITYNVLFGGNAAYEGQTGTIELVDGTWTVSRSEFCGFMAAARTSC